MTNSQGGGANGSTPRRDILAGSGPRADERRIDVYLSRLRYLLDVLRARPLFAVGYVIVATVILMAVFAPLIAPYPPETANPDDFLQSPSWRHLLGTDATGMDIFSRILYAPRIDLTIAIAGTAISRLSAHLSARRSAITKKLAACRASFPVSSCAPPMCCRPFRCLFSRSP
jgi:ABC-type antimicrobial peptide transport system permease subunit